MAKTISDILKYEPRLPPKKNKYLNGMELETPITISNAIKELGLKLAREAVDLTQEKASILSISIQGIESEIAVVEKGHNPKQKSPGTYDPQELRAMHQVGYSSIEGRLAVMAILLNHRVARSTQTEKASKQLKVATHAGIYGSMAAFPLAVRGHYMYRRNTGRPANILL